MDNIALCVITHKGCFTNRWAVKNLTEKISTVLKALRQKKGWSLDLASQKTGVSKAMLGQIERGESNPTIAVLWKIAAGFEVSFSSFIEDLPLSHSTLIHRGGYLPLMHPQDDKFRVMPLFPYDEILRFEMFIIELMPECEHISPPHQSGVIEHVIVTQGEIEVLVNGAWQRFQKNEGVRFNANKPHGYRNLTRAKAIFHNLVHYTPFAPSVVNDSEHQINALEVYKNYE